MSIAPSEGEIAGDDSITARTADGQEIFVDASIIYSIEPSQVIQVHIDWQDTYVEGLVRPRQGASSGMSSLNTGWKRLSQRNGLR